VRNAAAAAAVLIGIAYLVQNRWLDQPASAPPAGQAAATTTPPAATSQPDPRYADAPWEAMLEIDAGAIYQYDEAGGYRVADVTSPYVNVSDGERMTVAPPKDLGEPLDVWLLGGSAAFGSGQRDEHTIASDLVRAAAEDGVALRVHNFAVPASASWQEAIRFAYLIEWSERPDLVVFYDGFNDVFGQLTANASGQGASDQPTSVFSGQFNELLRSGSEDIPPEIGPVELAPSTTVPPVTDPGELADAVMRRYERSHRIIAALAEPKGVPVEVFWQPNLITKADRTDAEDELVRRQGFEGDALDLAERVSAAVTAELPAAGVRDLQTSLDATDDDVYLDVVQTNERGARIIADALYEQLRPQLLQLEGSR